MSAFMVSDRHLDYMVSAARLWSRKVGMCNWPRAYDLIGDHVKDDIEASDSEVWAILWRENARSVHYRYGTVDVGSGGVAGADPESPPAHRVSLDLNVKAVVVIKACQCYAYQACEHPGWELSAAKRFVDDLKRAAICMLPGYEEAAWGL